MQWLGSFLKLWSPGDMSLYILQIFVQIYYWVGKDHGQAVESDEPVWWSREFEVQYSPSFRNRAMNFTVWVLGAFSGGFSSTDSFFILHLLRVWNHQSGLRFFIFIVLLIVVRFFSFLCTMHIELVRSTCVLYGVRFSPV